jgi:hypothetical protein
MVDGYGRMPVVLLDDHGECLRGNFVEIAKEDFDLKNLLQIAASRCDLL